MSLPVAAAAPFDVKLLALDIDGTLLRDDGEISPVDRAAVERARAAGIEVTLATGRLSSATIPVAETLGLTMPLVCADGGAVYCPREQRILTSVSLPAAAVRALCTRGRAHGLLPFVFTHGAIAGAPDEAARFPFLTGWTPHHQAVRSVEVWAGANPQDVVTAIVVGPEDPARALAEESRDEPFVMQGVDVVAFPITGTEHWVTRLTPTSCSKATGLATVAAALGISARQVAVLGDWWNDVPMFEWAGVSFAMAHAPEGVRRTAHRSVSASARTGGGVEEAVSVLLSGRP